MIVILFEIYDHNYCAKFKLMEDKSSKNVNINFGLFILLLPINVLFHIYGLVVYGHFHLCHTVFCLS